MSRTIVISAVAALTVGAAALLPVPAHSGSPLETPPAPSYEGDMVIPPPGAPQTRMPAVVQTRGKLSYARGTYDIHMLGVPTSEGPVPWDEEEARDQVEALDAWFSAETEGRFRFRFAGLQILPAYPGSLCGLDAALAHAKRAIDGIRKSPGATDALPVVLATDSPECDAAGMAWLGSPGAWISENPEYPQTALKTFIHEIGHNIGLVHSAALPDADPTWPWPDGARPAVVEYGDASDVMGAGGQWICTWEECTFDLPGLNGHNRHLLRAVAPEQIDYVSMPGGSGESEVVELVSEEARVPGTQLVYLPWRNRSMFMLEYRPALGNDARIGDEYGPGAGVYLRVIGMSPTHTIARYPTQNRADWGSIAMPAGPRLDKSLPIPLGHREGASVMLTDGTVVEVLGTLADRASVRITRPRDTRAPTMEVPQIFYGNGTCSRYPCTAKASAIVKGKYDVAVPFGEYADNQWVSYAKVTINGALLEEYSRPQPDGLEEVTLLTPDFRRPLLRKSLTPGTYTFTYTYRDLVGNEGSSSYRLVLPAKGAR